MVSEWGATFEGTVLLTVLVHHHRKKKRSKSDWAEVPVPSARCGSSMQPQLQARLHVQVGHSIQVAPGNLSLCSTNPALRENRTRSTSDQKQKYSSHTHTTDRR